METGESIDGSVLLRLEKLAGKGLVVKLIDAFLEYTPRRMRDCLEGMASGDLAAVETALHSLKSSAGNLGAVRLQELCGKLEALAEQGDASGVAQERVGLETAYSLVCAQLVMEKSHYK